MDHQKQYTALQEKYQTMTINVGRLDERLEEQTAVHKNEMDAFIREHNQKYNLLLQEKLDLEDQ
jgi:chromosome segregation ATPase